jgi:WD40 repeat protein
LANPSAAHLVRSLAAHTQPVRDVLVTPNSGLLVSCAYDGKIKVWDYNLVDEETGVIGKVVKQYEHHDEFRCLAYNPLQGEILAGTEQNRILLFGLPAELKVSR